MKEVEALDAKFEEEAKIQANLNALAGQKVAAPAAAAQSVDLSGTAKTPDVLDRYDTDEYKRAFMNYVLTGKKIPAELTNVDANTKTSDVGAAIPTTTLQKIYEKIEATGMILPRVTHTSYKGGVTVPTSSAKPTASWVAEGAGSDKQKKALGSITFAYHKLRCAISMSLEVSIVTYPMFESQFVANVAEAMVKAEEQAIISGSGSGQPKGITKETVVTGQNIGMVDDKKQPVARVNYGLSGKPVYSLFGREVVLVGDYLPSFTASVTADTIFAFIFNFKDYLWNENLGMTFRKYTDNATDDEVTVALALVDGKCVDTNSLVTLTKKKA